MQIRKTNKYQITFRCINYQSWIKKTNKITFSTVYQLLRARPFWDNQVKVLNKKYRNATLPSDFFRPRYLKKFTDKYNFISSIFRRSGKNSIITYRTASAWNVCKKGKMKIYARFHPQLLQNGCKIRPAVILVLRRNGAWREGWKLFLNFQISKEAVINKRVLFQDIKCHTQCIYVHSNSLILRVHWAAKQQISWVVSLWQFVSPSGRFASLS